MCSPNNDKKTSNLKKVFFMRIQKQTQKTFSTTSTGLYTLRRHSAATGYVDKLIIDIILQKV